MALATMDCPGREKVIEGNLCEKNEADPLFPFSFPLVPREVGVVRIQNWGACQDDPCGRNQEAEKYHPLRTTVEVSRDLKRRNLTESVVPTKMGGIAQKKYECF